MGERDWRAQDARQLDPAKRTRKCRIVSWPPSRSHIQIEHERRENEGEGLTAAHRSRQIRTWVVRVHDSGRGCVDVGGGNSRADSSMRASRGRTQRQADPEGTALIGDAGHVHVAVMGLRNVFDNGQAETGSSQFPTT